MAAKSTIYVGGLDEQVTEEIVRAAFIPFGEIVDVQLPKDPGTCKFLDVSATF